MRLLILAMLSAITSVTLVPHWITVLSQTTTIPSVFLNEQLWTGGIITVLAAFLMWQQWIRENALRKETHEREVRMVSRIDVLEQQHAESCVMVAETISKVAIFESQLAQSVKDTYNAVESLKNTVNAAIDKAAGDRMRQEKDVEVLFNEFKFQINGFKADLASNCAACDLRRDDISGMISKLERECSGDK